MWKEYSMEFMKKNRASSISILIASLIATAFLSLITSLFYNVWVYDINQIITKEGAWQARITGELHDTDLLTIKNYPNIDQVLVNKDLFKGDSLTADLTFHNARTIFRDVPFIQKELGLPEDSIQYHLLLLSRYMIHDPADPQPPMLLGFYLFVLCIVSLSLILIIHNSFKVSMNARIHQFGIFSSIGATPRQILLCLMQEAFTLCILPILIGNGIGILLSYESIHIINYFAGNVSGRLDAVFHYHPLEFVITSLAAFITILLSAWLPARRLSKLTPLQAIRNSSELQLTREKRSRFLSRFFGIEGELAGNALIAQKKVLPSSTLSLTLSFLGFTLMLCFTTLSGISTNYTYFEKYQNAWDLMFTIKNTKMEEFNLNDEIDHLTEIRSHVLYQKAFAQCEIPVDWQSDELKELGGLSVVSKDAVLTDNTHFIINSPLVILDDESFFDYCSSENITPGLDGVILLNRIWDSLHSNFRYREYVPYLNETRTSISLINKTKNKKITDLKILGFTENPPVLWEEYEDYALVQILPLSLWETISHRISTIEADSFLRILASKNVSLTELNTLENTLLTVIRPTYQIESKNRIQEKISDTRLRECFVTILGVFCVLLALIGIANIFTNTLSFLRLRKHEFCQYMSVGMTVGSMRKILMIEAFVTAGRPLAITLPLTILSVTFMINASYLDPMDFIKQAPLLPILLFFAAIAGSVSLAYYIGGKLILHSNLLEALRNDGIV